LNLSRLFQGSAEERGGRRSGIARRRGASPHSRHAGRDARPVTAGAGAGRRSRHHQEQLPAVVAKLGGVGIASGPFARRGARRDRAPGAL
jgi:hypothetical protein